MCKWRPIPIVVLAALGFLLAGCDSRRPATAQAQPAAPRAGETGGAADKADKSDIPADQPDASAQRPSTAEAPTWRFLPLCEINRLDMPRFYALGLPGIRAWAEVTDTIGVITSRMPETYRHLWPRLQRDVPGVTFIPGVKLRGHPRTPTRIDDPGVWRSLAEAVRVSCELTRSPVCLLECESGLNPYLEGEYEPDWDRVTALIETLPDVTYYLYPPVRGAGELREKTERWVRTFVKVKPDTVLVTFGWSTRKAPDSRHYRTMQRLNESIAPCIDICYSYDLDSTKRAQDWRPEHLPRLVAGCPRPFIIYGWSQSPRNARQLAVTMKVLDAASREAGETDDLRAKLEQAFQAARARGAIPE